MLVELSYEVSEQAIQIRLLVGKKAMEMILPEKLSTCVCIFLSEIQLSVYLSKLKCHVPLTELYCKQKHILWVLLCCLFLSSYNTVVYY